MNTRCLHAALAVLACASFCASAQAQRTLAEDTGFGANPGALQMFHYVPADLPADAPLVVVAHGCMQTAQEMADRSGWTALADRHGIALLFPQTSKDNEPFAGCFRTWLAGHQARDAGEPLSVRQMIERMREKFRVSTSRTYITGMSSGGHLANVMLATYPEVFAAGAPQSSFPYKCAMAFEELAPCASGERDFTARQWGELGRSGHPGHAGPWPKVQIWHGSADPVIRYPGQHQQVLQWTEVHGIDADADASDDLLGRARSSWAAPSGLSVVQTVTVQDMGHAIAVDPGSGAQQCGTTGPYSADVDICAAYWIGRFFGIVD